MNRQELLPTTEPNADQPEAPESKPGSKPKAKEPLPEKQELPHFGRNARQQEGGLYCRERCSNIATDQFGVQELILRESRLRAIADAGMEEL
jgi:hypothetical protein